MAKKRLGELLLELKAKTPGAMPIARARSRSSRRSRRRSWRAGGWARSWSRCAPSPRRTCCRRSGMQLGIALQRRTSRPTTSTSSWRRRSRSASPSSTGCWWSSARATPRWWRRRSAGDRRASTICACSCRSRCSRSWCPSQRILEVINDVYGRKADKGGELGKEEDEEDEGGSEELVDILELTDEAPIIRWVNSLLFHAVKERASDIHIEPGEKEVIVRYRIDGELYESRRAARQFMPSIISRVKIMAGLNIAEKRLPQDGRIRRKIAGKDIDMRVATAPTVKRASASPSVCSIANRCCTIWPTSASATITCGRWTTSSTGRTASCWSPGRPARARRRRSTPASPRSTRPTSTSSPSRIRSSTSSTASRRPRSTRRST